MSGWDLSQLPSDERQGTSGQLKQEDRQHSRSHLKTIYGHHFTQPPSVFEYWVKEQYRLDYFLANPLGVILKLTKSAHADQLRFSKSLRYHE